VNKKYAVFVIILILVVSTFSVVCAEEESAKKGFWSTLWDTAKNIAKRGIDKLMDQSIPLPMGIPIPIKVRDAINVGKAVYNFINPEVYATEPEEKPETEGTEKQQDSPEQMPSYDPNTDDSVQVRQNPGNREEYLDTDSKDKAPSDAEMTLRSGKTPLLKSSYLYGGGGLFGLSGGTKIYAEEYKNKGTGKVERIEYYVKDEGESKEVEYLYNKFDEKGNPVLREGGKWVYKGTNEEVEGTDDVPPPHKSLSLKGREDVVYKLTHMLLQKTLGKFASDKISEKCEADWESSEPESNGPISTDEGLYTTEEGACPNSDDTIITCQGYISSTGPPYNYELSYTITACKEQVAYTVYLEGPMKKTIDSGDVVLGDSVTKTRSISSTIEFDSACVMVSDSTVGNNGEACFPLATS
jgi:hypothetical protein